MLLRICLGFMWAAWTAPSGDVFVRKQIPTDEGHISYQVRAGEGPGLILIPGSFHDNREWDGLLPYLDARLPLLLVELRGHGESWPPPANGSIEQFARDVLQVADAQKWDKFYVGGHSIGGMVALEVARVKPERVLGVLSLEGWTNAAAPRQAWPGKMSNTLTSELKAAIDAERQRATARWTEQQKQSFASYWRRWDGYEFLKTTNVPVLEIYGDRGDTRPALELLSIPDRPNIWVRWIAGVSHWLVHEKPAGVAAAMNEFLHQTRAARHLDHPSLLANPLKLTRAAGQSSLVYRGRNGESQFNLHS